ncbi:MAG: sensor histidine kinase [Planctomycetota bacterium]
MWPRFPLRWPILLAIGMTVLVAVLAVGWVLLSVVGAMSDDRRAALYWTLLPVGGTFLVLLLVGVVVYLVLTIKAINLTQRQSNFIDSVTHELKSPIASLKLYLQTLTRYQVSAEEQESFYHFMLDDVERLDRLINQMLEAGRLDAAGDERDSENVDLSALLSDCAAAATSNYRVPLETVRLDCQPLWFHARRNDLELVFRNLIDNAVKYAGSPPQVEVSLARNSLGGARVRIRDNGRGIPRPLRREIFGRFVRLGSELERERPGTGLGLYIVRTVANRLRGRVVVRDGESGVGTVFEVHLPRQRSMAPASNEPNE